MMSESPNNAFQYNKPVMETPSFSEDLQRLTAILWRYAWLIILAGFVAAGLVYLISLQITPIYQATTSILINEAPATRGTDYNAILTSERLSQTYAQLLTKQPVLEGVRSKLSLPMTLRELEEVIQVQPVRDTTLIEVMVEDPDPVLAAQIANEIVAQFIEQNQEMQASRYTASKESLAAQLSEMDSQIQTTTDTLAALSPDQADAVERDRLESILAQYRQTYAYLLQSFEQVRLAEAQSTSNVIQAEPATPPDRPISPRILVNTILAGIVGAGIALGIIFLFEAMDDSIKGPDELGNLLGLPLLGMIIRHNSQANQPVTFSDPRSPVAEAFRSLRTNIQFASVDRPLKTLLVTSPSPAEGKSTIAANLSVVMAQNDRKVVLIDADLRKPKIHILMNLSNRTGISNLFVQNPVQLDGTLQSGQVTGLSVLPAGDTPPNPAELLGSGKMKDILIAVEQQCDIVILDSPPVMAVADSAILAPQVDGVLLVLKPNVTIRQSAVQSVDQLRRSGANLLGVVLNEVDIKRNRYNYYRYRGYLYGSKQYFNQPNPGWRKYLPWLNKPKKQS